MQVEWAVSVRYFLEDKYTFLVTVGRKRLGRMDFDSLDQLARWKDPYDVLDGKVGAKVGIVLFQLIILCFGTMVDLSVIMFERYGEDPQKRGILNQVKLS